MSTYEINEASFALPSGWVDRSLNLLAPESSADGLKVVISRAPQGSNTLDQFVEQQTKESAQRVPWFAERQRSERQIAGARAIEIRATFRDGRVPMIQRQVSFAAKDKFVVISVMSLETAERACDEAFERLLATARLRNP
jgi:hypothetical protein